MDNRVIHRQPESEELKDTDQRSHLVQRAGTRDAGLFPGWGPKI
jgi:hypothetical protein